MGQTPPEGPGIGDGNWLAGAFDAGGPPTARRRSAVRIINVVIWAVLSAVFCAGGVGEVTIGNVGGAVLSFVLAVFSAWYAVRVWTFRARRLLGPATREWRR